MSTVKTYPYVPLRGMVIFPMMMIHLDIGRKASIGALESAMIGEKRIFVSTQKDEADETPGLQKLYSVGVVAEVHQVVRIPGNDNAVRVLVEGLYRGRIERYDDSGDFVEVEVEEFEEEENIIDDSIEVEALTKGVVKMFESWVKTSRRMPAEAIVSVSMVSPAGRMADLIASHLNLTMPMRQEILSRVDQRERLEKMYEILKHELEVLDVEKKIGNRVKKQMEKLQKEHYLHEQIKAIHKELGDDEAADVEEFRKRLREGNYPEEVEKVVNKELKRLERSNASSEGNVIYTYIDTLLNLPWSVRTQDHIDIAAASKVLDKDHYGLEKVKERILEYLAVRKLAENMKAPILCLVGPPGVGKTSLAASVARAIGRKFVRASLGGVRDEAEIRGHRRTYVGAMPGRILEAIRKAGSRNPVFLLDEVDKMAADYKGDPTAALLEVLDPAQNNTFSDHYVEVPFDLSDVLWIITANDLGNIPRPLRDRMEIITLSSYTEAEKLEIGKRYLIARQRVENGLSAKQVRFGAGVLQKMITEYTREAGVRELERVIGHACRKVARKIVEEDLESVSVTVKNLTDILGKVKFPHRKADKKPEVGICTGMAWTQVGGDILPTEVNIFPGKGRFILTGKLGDVMKESAQAAMSYIRSRQEILGVAEGFHEKVDIHVHFPEGAVPKDGPSAGITMATAITSALTGQKVRSDVAMTGEITIRGRVLAIGGLKEKVLAAYREGMKTIVLPEENQRDIEEIPESIREKLEFVPAKSMDEVLEVALIKDEAAKKKTAEMILSFGIKAEQKKEQDHE